MKGRLLLALALAPCCADESPPRLDRAALLDPDTCKGCHVEQHREWSGSMHAYAADDPVFLAMNQRGQRETNGELGAFCVNCHAPMAVRQGATMDGLNLEQVPKELKGVTCYFCHNVENVGGTHNNPLQLANDGTLRGPFADPVENGVHDSGYSALHDRDTLDSATLCGACHDIVTGHGAAIERTFTEWRESVFSSAPGGTTCGQCHMPQSQALEPIARAPNVFPRRAHDHSFVGLDVALTPFPEMESQWQLIEQSLAETIQSALCVGPSFAPKIHVILDNVGAGHSWPSGATPDRRAWVELVAESGDQIAYQSGVVPDGVPATETWSTDPDMWLIRDCIFDASGAEVHMFWQAADYENNALPAKVTFNPFDPRFYQTHKFRSFPRDAPLSAMPDRVTMRVRIQPMGLDVIDDLIETGDLDPSLRETIPTFTVGQTEALTWTAASANATYYDQGFPVSCVTNTNLDVNAERHPAVEHVRCRR